MKFKSSLFLLLLVLATACSDDAPPTVAPVADTSSLAAGETAVPSNTADQTNAETIVPTETAVPPTPTPSAPLAALVNDEPILLETFEKELARYEQAQAELGAAEEPANRQQVVLDALIERELIQQAAAAQGITVTDEMVEQQMAELQEVAGGPENFAAWLEANQWTEEEFRAEVASGMVTEQMVAAVTTDVPFAVEQVRARYIQVDDATLANMLLTQIQNGDDFSFLAEQHSLDRVTGENGGDLGFFAPGSLLVPEIETAAFALAEPGDVSDVISVTGDDGQTTYYLVQLVERDPQRPLPPDMRYTLLQQAFESWLDELWESANIVRLVETG